MAGFEVTKTVYDVGWDLFAFTGYFPRLDANVVVFRGTDSKSIYNWVENMHYWRSDFNLPFPGAQGAMVHTGETNSVAAWDGPFGPEGPKANPYILSLRGGKEGRGGGGGFKLVAVWSYALEQYTPLKYCATLRSSLVSRLFSRHAKAWDQAFSSSTLVESAQNQMFST